ncbi:MAG: hypothetical protein PHD56_11565 [Anaerostipes sp.]|nr:hypothetical protein [Anaerostipes sp.]
MKKILLILAFTVTGCIITLTACPTVSYAYTQQQINQAKAWLSAHGYSPTRAGAEQAYADYKKGKWNDQGEAVTKDKSNSKKESTTEKSKNTDSKDGEETIAAIQALGEATSSDTKVSKKKTEATTEKQSKEELAQQKKKVEEQKKEAQKRKRHQQRIYIGVGAAGIIFLIILFFVLKKRM